MRFYKFILNDNRRLLYPFNNNCYFRDFLLEKNLKPVSYKIILKRYKVSNKILLEFTYNLISLLETNMSITLALELIMSQEEGIFSVVLWNVRKDIINGSSIYDAFSKYKEIFPNIYLNLISVGEKTNNINSNLFKAYENLKFKEQMIEKIKEAIFYPTIISIFLFLLLIFIFSYVLPNFKSFFEGSEIELPIMTKILLLISDNIWKIVILICLVIFSFLVIIKLLPESRVEKLKFSTPFLKFFFRNSVIINFSQNFYLMLDSKLNILEALLILKNNSKYNFFKEKIDKVIFSIRNGDSVYNSFKNISFFSEEQLKIVNIGEKTQKLSKAFEIVSIGEKKKLERKLFKITTLIQPILLSIMGIIVAVLLLAIYLPIFNISNNII